ncbi:hypothetical protein ACF0H5_003919 [Mactra antiquata]
MKVFILLALVAVATATNFYNAGVCPDNKGSGERWNPVGTCSECYCDHTGYGCSGCDAITPVIGCYQVVDTSLSYPECCPRLECPPIDPMTGK